MKPAVLLISALFAATGLAACSDKGLLAPVDRGVCYNLATLDGESAFNPIARDQPDIEHCAAELEKMRLDFIRVGAQMDTVIGSYQGRYVFLTKDGIFTSDRIEGHRYPLLVRYNGKLVVPGAVPQ